SVFCMGSATWSKPRTRPTGCAIASEAAAEAPAATIPFTKRRRDAGLDIHIPDSLLEALKGITTRGPLDGRAKGLLMCAVQFGADHAVLDRGRVAGHSRNQAVFLRPVVWTGEIEGKRVYELSASHAGNYIRSGEQPLSGSKEDYFWTNALAKPRDFRRALASATSAV